MRNHTLLLLICILRFCVNGDALAKSSDLTESEWTELLDAQSGNRIVSIQDAKRRFLRGGTFSRSSYSGSSYSRTSYSTPSYNSGSYYHDRSYYGSGATLKPNLGIFLFLVCGLVFPCCFICSAIRLVCLNRQPPTGREEQLLRTTSNPPNYRSTATFAKPMRDFDDCVRDAKADVEGGWNRRPIVSAEPHSGKYSTSYVDGTTHIQWNATLRLYFTPDFAGRGYNLSGEGHDVDGMTVIEDGHANYDGTAWWKERTVTGDVGLLVLSKGKFDFANRTFQGNWLANSGEGAAYITFHAEEDPTMALDTTWAAHPKPSAPPAAIVNPQSSAQTLVPIAMATAAVVSDDDNIPTVTASLVDDKRF